MLPSPGTVYRGVFLDEWTAVCTEATVAAFSCQMLSVLPTHLTRPVKHTREEGRRGVTAVQRDVPLRLLLHEFLLFNAAVRSHCVSSAWEECRRLHMLTRAFP